MHSGPARANHSRWAAHFNALRRLPQRHHYAFRRLNGPQHMRGPGVEGVALLGVELVQVVDPMQALLPVPDAQLSDVRCNPRRDSRS